MKLFPGRWFNASMEALTCPRDASRLLSELSPEAIQERLLEIDAEARALRILFRAARVRHAPHQGQALPRLQKGATP